LGWPWNDAFNYGEITRIQIGDRYQAGLARYDDPDPASVAGPVAAE